MDRLEKWVHISNHTENVIKNRIEKPIQEIK